MSHRMRFRALRIDPSTARWAQHFREFWPAYRQWYLKEGDAARPSLDACERAMTDHMPELLDTWRELSKAAGGDPTAARMLSLYRPPAYIFGCSQAVWGGDEPFLIRNYDYSPDLSEGVILHTRWGEGQGTRVIGMSDCLWGLVDGINEHGLAVSLTFGGRKESGDGFGIPIILRYVLQVARDTGEAVEVLRRVPSHMSYNVMVLDAAGDHAMVEMAPDRPVRITDAKLSTNHQRPDDWPAYAERTKTLERAEFIAARLKDQGETPGEFVERFADDPLYHTGFEEAFGTLYTSVYRPKSRRAEFIWPGFVSRQSIDNFREGEAHILYGDAQLEVEETLYPAWDDASRWTPPAPANAPANASTTRPSARPGAAIGARGDGADGRHRTAEPKPGATPPPVPPVEDWRRFLVDIPDQWKQYLPEFMR